MSEIQLREPLDHAVLLRRTLDGVISTNVPHRIYHHSQQAFDWGKRYSPSAIDLALNILQALLERRGYTGPTTQGGKNGAAVFVLAWRLRLPFKERFLDPLPVSGGAIALEDITEWMESQDATF